MTLREVAASDVSTLFTLFSDPAVTALHGSSPTLAKFAGFVEWSHQERSRGHGVCFGIVPDGMAAAVGILRSAAWIRRHPTPSGFVLSAHFWSTGVFPLPTCSWSLRFTTCTSTVLKRASLCAIGAHTPPCTNSVRGSTRRSRISTEGIPRDPEAMSRSARTRLAEPGARPTCVGRGCEETNPDCGRSGGKRVEWMRSA